MVLRHGVESLACGLVEWQYNLRFEPSGQAWQECGEDDRSRAIALAEVIIHYLETEHYLSLHRKLSEQRKEIALLRNWSKHGGGNDE